MPMHCELVGDQVYAGGRKVGITHAMGKLVVGKSWWDQHTEEEMDAIDAFAKGRGINHVGLRLQELWRALTPGSKREYATTIATTDGSVAAQFEIRHPLGESPVIQWLNAAQQPCLAMRLERIPGEGSLKLYVESFFMHGTDCAFERIPRGMKRAEAAMDLVDAIAEAGVGLGNIDGAWLQDAWHSATDFGFRSKHLAKPYYHRYGYTCDEENTCVKRYTDTALLTGG